MESLVGEDDTVDMLLRELKDQIEREDDSLYDWSQTGAELDLSNELDEFGKKLKCSKTTEEMLDIVAASVQNVMVP